MECHPPWPRAKTLIGALDMPKITEHSKQPSLRTTMPNQYWSGTALRLASLLGLRRAARHSADDQSKDQKASRRAKSVGSFCQTAPSDRTFLIPYRQ